MAHFTPVKYHCPGRWSRCGVALVPLLILLFAPFAMAQEPAAGIDPAVERGQRMFQVYCGSCHGLEARGDGTVADLLKVTPPDLTTLRQRNDGRFPTEQVHRTIDGREELRAHGSREMPIWGIGLQDLSRDSDQENEVAGRIADLVRFLATIQQ